MGVNKAMPYHEINFLRTTLNKLKVVGFNPKFFAYRAKWNIIGKYPINTRTPIHVDIQTASVCNLKCTMCPHSTKEYDMVKGLIDFELSKKIIRECSRFGVSSLKLSGNGEALLHPKLTEMVKIAKSEGIMDVMFNTNGLLLSEERSRDLVDAGIDLIIVSIDGATAKTYEAIRIGSNYETVKRNVEYLLKYRNEKKKKKPMVRLQFVKMKENIHEFNDFLAQWRDKADVLVAIDYSNRIGQESKDVKERKKAGRAYCPHPWRRLTVTVSGQALMCCVDWKCEYEVGNCNNETIREIWNSERIKFGRKCIKQLDHEKIPSCRDCFSPISWKWK